MFFLHKQMHLEEGKICVRSTERTHLMTELQNHFCGKRVTAESDQVLCGSGAEAEHVQVLPLALHHRAAALWLLIFLSIFPLNTGALVSLESSVPDLSHLEQGQMSNHPQVWALTCWIDHGITTRGIRQILRVMMMLGKKLDCCIPKRGAWDRKVWMAFVVGIVVLHTLPWSGSGSVWLWCVSDGSLGKQQGLKGSGRAGLGHTTRWCSRAALPFSGALEEI